MQATSYLYLLLSFAPGVCVLAGQGPMTGKGIMAVVAAIILSPLLTLVGLLLARFAKPPHSTVCWFGTVLSALPGLYLLVAIPLARH